MRDKFAKFDRGDLVKTIEPPEALGFMATCKPQRWGKLGIIIEHSFRGKEWWVKLEDSEDIHLIHEHDMKMVFKSQ